MAITSPPCSTLRAFLTIPARAASSCRAATHARPTSSWRQNVGVVYTGSSSKQSEHGGYAFDDTDVILLVSNPHIEPKTVTSWVETMQVAPTILQLLGLDPSALDAVRMEGTAVLPGLFDSDQN